MQIKDILNSIKNLNNKSVIQVYLSTTTTITTNANQTAQIPLDTVLKSKGNSFSLSNSAININKKMTVRVSSKISLDRQDESNSRVYGLIIEKNSYALTYQNLKRLINESYEEISCEAVLDVTSGDKIYLDLRTVAATNIKNEVLSGRCMTNLIIEEI